jgi:valyl-tRNA synthetase
MSGRDDRVTPIDASALPKQYDASEAERRWRERWEEWDVHRSTALEREGPRFAVDSPPPTASGALHVGHVFSYTHQDLVVRYRRMKGDAVFYPMGWDDNGLPTERRVQNVFHVRPDPYHAYEADLKLERVEASGRKAKDLGEPRTISRRNFVELCHVITAEDEVAFKDLFRRLGLSVDWREEYATIDDRSRAVAQRSFLDLLEKGHIYQVEAPTMWDVDFGTAVAQAEVEDRPRQGAFHDIEFGTEAGGSFVISTTRPELLPACVGVAAHPDDERYQPLFGKRAITPIYGVPVPIFPTPMADPEKGTGILMVCTFGDQTDVVWWRDHELPLRQIVGRDGRIQERRFGAAGWESRDPERANRAYAELQGKRVNQARRIVVEQLRDPAHSASGGGAPLQGEPRAVEHAVRFYEKGDSPLEIVTSRQWFVRLMDKKEQLVDFGRRIHWHPAHMGKRYENWTRNLQLDWAISRQRHFGVSFPLWYRLDGEGGEIWDGPILAPLASLPVDPMSQPPPGFEESRRGQPGGFQGEPDVFDTWFTSSMTPQIAAHWGSGDERRLQRLLPMDVRPQSHEIIRTWAFYTIAKSMLHHGEVPWHDVVISGWILDPERKKMSKSRGNALTPVGLLDDFGADPVRYWAARARLGADTAFDEKMFKIGRRLVTKLYNAGRFVLTQEGPRGPLSAELDRAFAAELRALVERATAAFEEFEYSKALEETESFFWGHFTDNYLELVKRRARAEDDDPGRASALAGLRLGLSVLLRLFAPVLPTITEEVWSWAFAEESGHRSIHLAAWPGAADFGGLAAPGNAESFAVAAEAIAAVRRARTGAALGMGRPLKRCRLKASAADLEALGRVQADVVAAANAPALETAVEEPAAEAPRFSAEIEAAPAD